jgi:hypothetical protein
MLLPCIANPPLRSLTSSAFPQFTFPETPSTPWSRLRASASLSFRVTPHLMCTRSTSEPSFSNTLNHVNVNILRLYIQPRTSRGLRPDEPDLPAIGGTGPDTEIESLRAANEVGADQGQMGGPTTSFQDRDSHCDMWLTERVLRQRYPTSGPRLIEAYDAAATS